MIVSYLPEPDKHPLWPAIKGLLEPAAKLGGIPVDPEEVIWIIHENGVIYAAAATHMWGDGEAELRIVGGTRMKDWVSALDAVVSSWAKAGGANKLTMWGRKGWRRFAKRQGWVALGEDQDGLTIYEKAL